MQNYTFSGSKPSWYIWRINESQDDYLGFLYENNPGLLKEVLDHMLYLEKQTIIEENKTIKGKYGEFNENFNGFMWGYYPEEIGFNKEEELSKFNSWWQTYKEKFNL